MRAFQPISQSRHISRRNYGLQQSPRPKYNLLLTFDAFGTLFEPKDSIAAQYAHVAQEHGIAGVEESDIQVTFKQGNKTPQLESCFFLEHSFYWLLSICRDVITSNARL